MRSADQERNEAWRDLVCRWKPLFWAEERGQIVSGIGPYLQRRAIERKAYTAREQFVSRGDKATRAQSFRGRDQGAVVSRTTRRIIELPAGKFSARDSKVRCYRAFGMTLPPSDGSGRINQIRCISCLVQV
jgi:hypothetical protein